MREDYTRFCVVAFYSLNPYDTFELNPKVDRWLVSTIAWLRDTYLVLPGPEVDSAGSRVGMWKLGIVEYDSSEMYFPLGGGAGVGAYRMSKKSFNREEIEQIRDFGDLDFGLATLALISLPFTDASTNYSKEEDIANYLTLLANSFANILQGKISKGVESNG